MATTKIPKIKTMIISGVPTLVLDMGDVVVCDECNEEWTDSSRSGGVIACGHALCPECFTGDLSEVSDVPSSELAFCPPDVSFADHVRWFRRTKEGRISALFKTDEVQP